MNGTRTAAQPQTTGCRPTPSPRLPTAVVPIRCRTTKRFCDFSQELLQNQGVTARALAKSAEAGIVDAAAMNGYYADLSTMMTTARSPSPANAKPALARFPR